MNFVAFCLQTSGKKEIPRFYFPTGPPLSPTARMQMESKIDSLLKRHAQGITVPAIKELFAEVCNSQDPHSPAPYTHLSPLPE